MKFGSVIRLFEFDFSRSPSNEAIFSLTVAQRDEPESLTNETELKFEAEFEGNMLLSLTK